MVNLMLHVNGMVEVKSYQLIVKVVDAIRYVKIIKKKTILVMMLKEQVELVQKMLVIIVHLQVQQL